MICRIILYNRAAEPPGALAGTSGGNFRDGLDSLATAYDNPVGLHTRLGAATPLQRSWFYLRPVLFTGLLRYLRLICFTSPRSSVFGRLAQQLLHLRVRFQRFLHLVVTQVGVTEGLPEFGLARVRLHRLLQVAQDILQETPLADQLAVLLQSAVDIAVEQGLPAASRSSGPYARSVGRYRRFGASTVTGLPARQDIRRDPGICPRSITLLKGPVWSR